MEVALLFGDARWITTGRLVDVERCLEMFNIEDAFVRKLFVIFQMMGKVSSVLICVLK